MKISRIETIPVLVPILPERAIKARGGYHTESPFLIVKVHTDAGITGLGEVSCTPIWSGEDHFTAARIIETLLAPALIGEDPTAIERLTLKMSRSVAGNPFTKSGIEMALWDILGKVAGLPVYKLLGGPVRDSVQIKFSISGLASERAAEIASWAVDQGFRTVKVKVGIDPEEDVARVRAVREAIGSYIRVGVDANGGWNVREAIQTIRRLEEFDLLFVEQPVPANDVAWMADVRAHCNVPVLADESVYTPQDALALISAGAADAFSVYVGKGGIGPARKVAAIAEAAGLSCTVGSNLELGIATAAMIHLAIATPGIDPGFIPCDIIGPYYYPSDLLESPLAISNGEARPPEFTGLGVLLDDDKVDSYRVRLQHPESTG